MINLSKFKTKSLTADQFPNLNLIFDIVYFEGPLISLFRESNGNEYIKCWADSNRSQNRWCLIKINRTNLKGYLKGDLSLFEIYNKSNSILFFNQSSLGRRSAFLEIQPGNLPPEYTPSEDSFLTQDIMTQDAKVLFAQEVTDYILGLDGDLYFDDISKIPYTYLQLYAFHYGVHQLGLNNLREKLQSSIETWTGGISVVNLFNGIKKLIPSIHRAHVVELKYNSPGLIKLNLVKEIAEKLELSLSKISNDETFSECERLYKDAYKFLKKEGLSGFDEQGTASKRELTAATMDSVNRYFIDFSNKLGWSEGVQEFSSLDIMPLQRLRIILSYYRRLKVLQFYSSRGNLQLGSSKLPN